MHTVHMCVRMHPPSLSVSLARSFARPRAMHSTCARTHTRENDAFSLLFSLFLPLKAHTYNTRTYAYAQGARARARAKPYPHSCTHTLPRATLSKRGISSGCLGSLRCEERTENLRTRGKNTRETRTTEGKRWRRILSRSLSLSFSFSSARLGLVSTAKYEM